MGRGQLRVYLGAAPGVGKTVAMLAEGARSAARGKDVVIAVVEDHGRAYTATMMGDLPVVPRRVIRYRGIELSDMDTAAVLARRPQLALVDEFAHTNPPGSAHPRRWQDVHELLAAGIDVITTVNVQHLESLNDIVAQITGITQAETIPDEVVRAADQIELVDMSPQALRRRMAHGHIYPADTIDAALGNYFREGNLTALRELALLWVADRVEEGLAEYRDEHGVRGTWAARERIVVALGGGPEGAALLRRGARIAGRVTGRDLVAVHVVRSDGSMGAQAADIARQRLLVEQLGGTFTIVVGDDVPAAVLAFARSVDGTQIVVGVSQHGKLTRMVRPSTSMAIVRGSGDIDVHMVTHQRAGHGAAGRWRFHGHVRPWAWLTAVVVPIALAAALLPWQAAMNLSTVLLVFLLGVLAAALVGGIAPAVVTAVLAGLLANFLYTRPLGSLTVAQPQNVFALFVFVAVGVTVASIVHRSRARAAQARQGRAEAQLLADVALRSATSDTPVEAILDQARIGFGMSTALLVSESPAQSPGQSQRETAQRIGARSGAAVDESDVLRSADAVVSSGTDWSLALFGHPLAATDRRMVEVIAAQAALALDRVLLARQAEEGRQLRQADATRTALLAAVSHDLRTPLSAIKASASSLLDRSVQFTEADTRELLRTIDTSADRLDDLVSNLLDLSRLHTGAVTPLRRPVSVDEVVHRALIGVPTGRIRNEIPDDLPLVDTDLGLMERVVANIVTNAIQHSPGNRPIRLVAGCLSLDGASQVQLRVIDHGSGVSEADRDKMFAPFQKLGDTPGDSGVGLGLAVARGLAEAVDATIEAEDTPGGGLTMILTVPAAPARVGRQPDRQSEATHDAV